MRTRIGKFEAGTCTVPVTFIHDGVTHRRPVRACLDVAGNFDEAATGVRVAEVALGVAAKIECGALR